MSIKRSIAEALAPYPAVFFPLARIFGPRKFRSHLVDSKDELVISGYPRSANTFATFAFLEAQGRPVSIARHLHLEAEVIEAARRGIPAIVLIRKPEEAIRSFKAAMPTIDENRQLKRWITYYTRIEPLRDKFVVADFARATKDFGSVIDEVNARFGTRFQRFETTEENCARVFERVRQDQEELGTQKFAGLPGDGRKELLQKQELKFDPRLLAQAHAIYARFEALSASGRKAAA